MKVEITKELLESQLAEGLSLEAIGKRVGRSPSTVSHHLKKHGLAPVNAGKHANRGGLEKETLGVLVGEGHSLAEIARRVDRSVSTARYWLKKHGYWPLAGGLRRAEARRAKELGLKRAELTCPTHGRTMFILEGRGAYRCLACRSERVVDWRRRAKARLVDEAGGRCVLCGYDRWLGALEFHHRDPSTKSFGLSGRGLTRAYETLQAEAAKCVLLCATCHAEVEGGFVALPVAADAYEAGGTIQRSEATG